MTTPISRRTLLRATGTTSLALFLAACTNDDPAAPTGEGGDAGTAGDAAGEPDDADIDNQAVEAVGLDAEPTLTAIIATFEVLTGADGRIPLGVLDAEQQPLLDRDVQLWVVREGEVVSGPINPLFHGEGLGARGVYVAEVDLDQAGLYDAVVQVDGDAVGVAAFTARTPEESTTYPPGATFPVIATPTEDDPGELEALCTSEPPCSMHEASLDGVLGTSPVVFTIATPQFCQTAVCGPVVDVVEDAKAQAPEGVTYIHAEVYTDAGNTYTNAVEELALPTEPWTWVIDGDGVVVDRFDGPVVPSLLQDAIARA